MKRLQRAAVIISLIEKMKERGSWCGETHIQKATFFLQRLFGVPLDYNFILYKHGPFSFDLREDITAMRADLILKIIPQYPYGSSYNLDTVSDLVKTKFPKTISNWSEQIEFVADNLGCYNVSELEGLATALYFNKDENVTDVREIAKKINQVKPHISVGEALIAANKVTEIVDNSLGLH